MFKYAPSSRRKSSNRQAEATASKAFRTKLVVVKIVYYSKSKLFIILTTKFHHRLLKYWLIIQILSLTNSPENLL